MMPPVERAPDQELSMDEILASIKRIVVDDSGDSAALAEPSFSAQQPRERYPSQKEPLRANNGDGLQADVLPLTRLVRDDGTVVDVTQLHPQERARLQQEAQYSARQRTARHERDDARPVAKASPQSVRERAPDMPNSLPTRAAADAHAREGDGYTRRWASIAEAADATLGGYGRATTGRLPLQPHQGRGRPAAPRAEAVTMQGQAGGGERTLAGRTEPARSHAGNASLDAMLESKLDDFLATQVREDVQVALQAWMDRYLPALVESIVAEHLTASTRQR